MSKLKTYYTDLVDNAVKAAANSAILVFSADQVNVISVNWTEVGGFAAGGAVLSALITLTQRGLSGRTTA